MRSRIGLGKCSHIQSIIPNSDLAGTRSPQKVIRRGCPFFSGCSFIILRRYRIVWGHSTAQLRAVWNLLTTFSCRTCVRRGTSKSEDLIVKAIPPFGRGQLLPRQGFDHISNVCNIDESHSKS